MELCEHGQAKKLEEIAEKQDVLDEISQAESIEDIQKILSTNGLEMSAEEIEVFAKSAGSAELDERSLDNVSGGGLLIKVAFRLGVVIGKALSKRR